VFIAVSFPFLYAGDGSRKDHATHRRDTLDALQRCTNRPENRYSAHGSRARVSHGHSAASHHPCASLHQNASCADFAADAFN